MDDRRNFDTHEREEEATEPCYNILNHTEGHTEKNSRCQTGRIGWETSRNRSSAIKFDFNVHRKVRKITGKFKMKSMRKLVADNGELIVDGEDIKGTWKKYIEQLFFDESGNSSLPH